jgi:branched-chain amino acid transport system permease protein
MYHTNYAQEGSLLRTYLQWALLLLGVVALFALPFHLPGEYLVLANEIGITIIVALGLQILTGNCGIISLGQAGFMCVGAYTSALLCQELGWSFWATLPCAAATAGLIGILFGLTSIRVGGFYLVVITLAAGFLLPVLVDIFLLPLLNIDIFSPVASSPPSIGGVVIDTHQERLLFILPFVIMATFFALNIRRGRIGRTLSAIRDNDTTSEMLGINIPWWRVLAFFTACVFAGVGGSLWSLCVPALSTGEFAFMESVWYLGAIIVGGMGSVAGVFLGSIIIRGLDFFIRTELIPWVSSTTFSLAMEENGGLVSEMAEKLSGTVTMRALGINPLLVSLVILFFLVFAPSGVVEWWGKLRSSFRIWPLSRSM